MMVHSLIYMYLQGVFADSKCTNYEESIDFIRCREKFEIEYQNCIFACDSSDFDCLSSCSRELDTNLATCPCMVRLSLKSCSELLVILCIKRLKYQVKAEVLDWLSERLSMPLIRMLDN